MLQVVEGASAGWPGALKATEVSNTVLGTK